MLIDFGNPFETVRILFAITIIESFHSIMQSEYAGQVWLSRMSSLYVFQCQDYNGSDEDIKKKHHARYEHKEPRRRPRATHAVPCRRGFGQYPEEPTWVSQKGFSVAYVVPLIADMDGFYRHAKHCISLCNKQ